MHLRGFLLLFLEQGDFWLILPVLLRGNSMADEVWIHLPYLRHLKLRQLSLR